MLAKVEFRDATAEDVYSAKALIIEVVAEIYENIIDDVPSTITSADLLANSVLAFVDQRLVGVGLTVDDVVDDIWLSVHARGTGVGSELLSVLEKQIIGRGYQTARLRVLDENTRACRFYEKHGWLAGQRYLHERLGLKMINYSKALTNQA